MSIEYKKKLKEMIENGRLSSPDHSDWVELCDYINQDVLDDAHLAITSEFVLSLYSPVNTSLMCKRAKKTMDRVQQKPQNFKRNCDLAGLRIFGSNIHELLEMKHRLNKYFDMNNIPYWDRDHKPDLVYFVYAYVNGYIVEVQIIHRFTEYTFITDSQIRDGAKHLVDLWSKDSNGEPFYVKARDYLIYGKERDYDLVKELVRLYDGSHHIPGYLLQSLSLTVTDLLKK